MIVIAGRTRLHASELEEALRAGSVMAVTSRAESGCIDYRFAIDIDDPLAVQVFEQWESAEVVPVSVEV
jgi:quinol monooxygenase YgiN